MKYIVAISGGKDSVAMALRLREASPDADFVFVCTPTGNELPEMTAHWKNLEKLLGSKILQIRRYESGDGLEQLISEQKTIPNFRMRFCTRLLKIEPIIGFLTASVPCIHYVGLRADEETRGGIYGNIEGIEHRYPLREWGWGINEVWQYLTERGVSIPRRTDCALCFFQRVGEWKSLYSNHPDLYEQGERIESDVGATFRAPHRDTWPVGLNKLRKEFQSGRKVPFFANGTQLSFLENCDMNQYCRVCTL